MTRFLRQLFEFDREDTPGDLLHFKVLELFAVGSAVWLAWSWGLFIPLISDIVLPLGIARFVDVSFMFERSLSIWNAAAITVLTLIGYFRIWRYAHLVAFLLLHLQYAARYTLGEIPHSSNLAAMALLAVALAVPAFAEAKKRHRFAFGFLYFYTGLAYFSAGISKFIGTGWAWADGRHLWLWLYEKSVDTLSRSGSGEMNPLQELALASMVVATALLLIGMVTEMTAFLVWFPRFRTLILTAILALHVGIYVSMGILFYLSMILLVILFPFWPGLFDRYLQVGGGGRTDGLLMRFSHRFA
jgi:hypothetical protein